MGILYENEGIAVFLVITVALGGAAAWATGRALAKTWRPYWQVFAYMVPLAGAVRFLHYALFSESLAAPQFYVTAYLVVTVAATAGYWRMRSEQMVTQYSFAFDAAGPFGWRAKRQAREKGG